MTVKEYLGQSYLLDQRIKSDTIELEELRIMAQTISSPGFEEHYNATKNKDAPYIKTIEKMSMMEEKILNEVKLFLELKEQIREIISQVEKPEYQMILKYRYIHNLSWSRIGDKMCADITTVQRWHNKAIARIKIPENPINLKVAMVCHRMP